MKKIQPINSFDKIKLLADSRRMDILRLLMASPATLTHLFHRAVLWMFRQRSSYAGVDA